MNTKTALFFSVFSIILSTATANANLLFDIYAGGTYGTGGYTLFADDDHISKSSQSYGAVLGIDIPLFRLEAEYNHINADYMALNIGMVNGYFKLPTPVVKPYIGVGVGTTFESKYEPDNAPHIEMDSAVTYQGMVGITLDLPVAPIKFDVEARALYANNVFEIADTKADLVHYDIRAKIRYIF